MPKTKSSNDKRVYELRVTTEPHEVVWRLLAVSADSTLPELYRAIQGAFDSPHISAHSLVIDGIRYEHGKGTRTLLRRVLEPGTSFECFDSHFDRAYACEVVRSYEVATRRHYPKVLGGAGDSPDSRTVGVFNARLATWNAQDAARGAYPWADEVASPLSADAGGPDVHGFFAAVVSGPIVMPSEWLPLVLGGEEREWSSAAEMQSAMSTVMMEYNSVAHGVQSGALELPIVWPENDAAGADLVAAWCRGYVTGMSLRFDEWKPLFTSPEVSVPLRMIAALAEDTEGHMRSLLIEDVAMRSKFLEALAEGAVAIAAHWRRQLFPQQATPAVQRSGPKVPRNDPCPCGSGKKYKRCCGSHLRAV